MVFQPEKIITHSEIQYILQRSLGLSREKGKALIKSLDIGLMDCISIHSGIVLIMDIWVEKMEYYLKMVKKRIRG